MYRTMNEKGQQHLIDFGASDDLVTLAQCEIDRGIANWITDPEHDEVMGLRTDDGSIVMILYLENEDFEYNTDWSG